MQTAGQDGAAKADNDVFNNEQDSIRHSGALNKTILFYANFFDFETT